MEELLKKLFAPKPTSNMSGFKFSDLLDNERWKTAQRESFNPNRGEMVDYRQYVPREPYADPSVLADTNPNKGAAASFTLPRVTGNPMFHAGNNPYDNHPSNYERNQGTTVKSVTSPEGGVTTTETTKYIPMDDNSYLRNEHRGYTPMERGPVRTTGTPFGHAIRPERGVYNDGMRGATPMMPVSNSRNFTPMSPIDNSRNFNPMMPIDQRTSATTYPYNMTPQADVGLMPISTQSTPQSQSVTPLQYSNQSQLNRFPEGVSLGEGMTDAMKRRMLELFFRGDGMRLTRND